MEVKSGFSISFCQLFIDVLILLERSHLYNATLFAYLVGLLKIDSCYGRGWMVCRLLRFCTHRRQQPYKEGKL